MKIITARKQREIDEINWNKMQFIANTLTNKYKPDGLTNDKQVELAVFVSDVFNADNVMHVLVKTKELK